MTRKLSEPKSRGEIISSFASMKFAAPAAPVDDSTETCPTCKGTGNADDGTVCPTCKGTGAVAKDTDATDSSAALPSTTPAPTDTADTDVDTAISSLRDDLNAAIKAQSADPDATTDDNDTKVSDVLAEMDKLLTTLETDQKADDAGDAEQTPDPSKAPPTEQNETPAKLALAPEDTTTPVINPVDESGNVDPDAICATDGCGHLASVHNDTDTGENSGACTAPECQCEQLTFGSNTTDGELAPTGGPDNQGGDGMASRGESFADAVSPVTSDDSAPVAGDPISGDDELNLPPEVTGGMNMGPAFTIPVAIIEGQPTGDGRDIALNALSWGPPPYALMGMATSTHDPMGFDPNDPAVLCGRIDSFERTSGQGDTQIIIGKGYFLANDDGMYFADLLDQMGRLPVSGDVTVDESEVIVGEVDEYGWPMDMSETLTKGTLAAVTILPFGPAFEGAYIVLGDGGETQAIPVTSDDVPAMPPALAAGGQIVHWIAASDCIPCDQGLDVMVAAGGPQRPPKAWFEDPKFSIDDGRLMSFIAQGDKGKMISGYACPPTVTEEGEVYGHLAPWGVCHIGQRGKCVTAPHSAVDYAHFKRGQHVITAEGETIRVGVLTANTGHADLRLNANASMAHYDNTAFQAADVVMFEDEYGIAYHGALRPDATEAQVRMLRASALSGDWREIGGQLELVAALAVNQPGFPMAITAHGSVTALTAAGSWQMFVLGHPEISDLTEEDGATLAKLARGPMIRLVRRDATERLAKNRSDVAKNARDRIKSLAGSK